MNNKSKAILYAILIYIGIILLLVIPIWLELLEEFVYAYIVIGHIFFIYCIYKIIIDKLNKRNNLDNTKN